MMSAMSLVAVLFVSQVAALPALMAARQAKLQRASDEYKATRTQDNCVFPLDIVLAQDCTSSLADDWDNMKNVQVPAMVAEITSRHPGSRFAIMCFQDKPFFPFGLESDKCITPHGGFTEAVSDLVSLYELPHFPYGGMDGPENQYQAIFAAVQAPLYEWSSLATPLVVVSTDAAPHFDADGLNPGLPAFSGIYNSEDPQGQCVSEYYPSPTQVKDLLHARLTYLAALVYDPNYMYGLTARSWKWLIEYIGESEHFLNLISSTSDDFWARLSEVIVQLENAECGLDSTTPDPELASTCPPCVDDTCDDSTAIFGRAH